MAYTLRTVVLVAAALASSVSAHGILTSPQPRVIGAAYKAACGMQAYNAEAGDKEGNIQNLVQNAANQKDFNAAECNVWLCKGFQFADNTANVQKFTAGQVVPMTFNIGAPHAGTANVSIVNTATNSVIGSPLASYDDFASNTGGKEGANETSFSVTIPSDLGTQCSTAGACVVQHFWDSRSAGQTYMSCVDFTV